MNIRENLKAYLDGELNAPDRAEVEEALKSDPALQLELQQMKEISQSLRGAANPVNAVGLAATLERLAKPRTSLGPRWLLPTGLAATAILAIFGAGWVLHSNRDMPFQEEIPMPMANKHPRGSVRNLLDRKVDARWNLAVDNMDPWKSKVDSLAASWGASVIARSSSEAGKDPQLIYLMSLPTSRMESTAAKLKDLGATQLPLERDRTADSDGRESLLLLILSLRTSS